MHNWTLFFRTDDNNFIYEKIAGKGNRRQKYTDFWKDFTESMTGIIQTVCCGVNFTLDGRWQWDSTYSRVKLQISGCLNAALFPSDSVHKDAYDQSLCHFTIHFQLYLLT